MSSGGSWLQFGNSSNKFKSSYVRGFLDVCGNIQVREGGLTMSDGDISCNGDIYVNRIRDHEGNLIVSSSGSGTVIDDTTNLTINSLTEVKSTSRLTGNVGIGKASTSNALDVSGNTKTSGKLIVNGNSELLGSNVSVGKVLDTNYNLDVNGSIRVSDDVYAQGSLIVTSGASATTDTSGAILYIKDNRLNVSNNVILDAPNSIFKASQNGNPNRTNILEIDSKNRRILPYVKDALGNVINEPIGSGWELGGANGYRLDTIYARDVKISTNTLLIEDDSGNLIGMSFDAATGAVNYNVTTALGEQFTIKGVQTQKISSGSGSIDPSLLEFTGLSFGDTFDCSVTRDLTNAVTYNLDSLTYSSDFLTSSAGTQSLGNFLGAGLSNIAALLGTIEPNDSVTIKVNDDDRLDGDRLDGIDISGSFIDLTGKIISVENKAGSLKWKVWGSTSELNNNVAGNFLNYIELKNINMASGTYFIAKTSGNIVYNNANQDYLSNNDLIGVVNGDLFLYIDRSPGNNWTKIPVSLPSSASITTQMLADQAVTSSKIGSNSIVNSKLAPNSVTTDKIADLSITASKIQPGAISGSVFADDSISGIKIATGTIPLDRLDGNALSGKQDTLVAGSNISIDNITNTISASVDVSIPTSSITNDKMAINSINTNNIVSNSVTGAKIANNTITILNMAVDSVGTTNIENNAITSVKITDGNITSAKLATASITAGKIAPGAVNIAGIMTDGVVTSAKLQIDAVSNYIAAGSNVTLSKNVTTGIVTIASSGGGGGGTLTDGSVTTVKLADSAVTSAKLDKNVVDSFITAGSNVTLTKDSGTGIVTIASSGGGGGGGGGGGTINAVQGFYSVDPSTNVVDPLNTNIGVGRDSLVSITTGFDNTAFGYKALTTNTTGKYNTAFGNKALTTNISGQYNTAFGNYAYNVGTGTFNTAIGSNALEKATFNNSNTCVGAFSGSRITDGGYNCMFGSYTGLYSTGSANVIIGSDAGYSIRSGSYSCVIGQGAGRSNLICADNCIIGADAGNKDCTKIVALGRESLRYSTGNNCCATGYRSGYANSTGINNTFLGYQSNTIDGTFSNSTAIGANSSITASNQVTLGTATEYVLIPSTQTNGLDVTTDVIANAFTIRSDVRIKKNINDIDDDSALQQLRLLKPKTYQYIDTSNTSSTVIGFLAQDVEKVIPYATGVTTNFIPSIFETCTLIESNKLQLDTKTTSDISLNLIDASGNPYTMLKVSNATSTFFINVTAIQDDKTLIIDSDSSNNYIYKDVNNTNLILDNGIYKRHVFTSNTDASGSIIQSHLLDASGIPVLEEYTGTVTTTIFVYGHKVTDFHTIKNDSIFTVAAAASQELDRQLQESKSVIVSLQTTINDLKSQLIIKDQQITSIEQRLSALENP
jgi:hypothetical protein